MQRCKSMPATAAVNEKIGKVKGGRSKFNKTFPGPGTVGTGPATPNAQEGLTDEDKTDFSISLESLMKAEIVKPRIRGPVDDTLLRLPKTTYSSDQNINLLKSPSPNQGSKVVLGKGLGVGFQYRKKRVQGQPLMISKQLNFYPEEFDEKDYGAGATGGGSDVGVVKKSGSGNAVSSISSILPPKTTFTVVQHPEIKVQKPKSKQNKVHAPKSPGTTASGASGIQKPKPSSASSSTGENVWDLFWCDEYLDGTNPSDTNDPDIQDFMALGTLGGDLDLDDPGFEPFNGRFDSTDF